LKDIEGIFVEQGGDFNAPPFVIQQKLEGIKAFVFDWDGVFNFGRKGKSSTSDFTEGDSMGINMVRFSYRLKYGHDPLMFIATGAQNPTAIQFAQREHFNAVIFGVLRKADILPLLQEKYDLKPEDCAFVFDDILDLSLAKRVALRFYIRKQSNPLLNSYVLRKELSDYMSGHDGDSNAVREISELIISLNENYDETIAHRAEFDEVYTSFKDWRNSIEPAFFRKIDGIIKEVSPEI
jgi:3-deoxy-D-manno-octulosonate 8-phosphate phosphatase (KDO 8-P phosphatase)